MSDTGKQDRIEDFLRKSLLGEEVVNTQFHLFSARSSPSGWVLKPRILCANNILLAKSSKYFLDLLSTDVNPSDPSLIDLADDRDVPNNARMDDYGYESDSDLDECNDPIPVRNHKAPKQQSKDDDELSDDGSVSSDLFVMSPEQPRGDEPFFEGKDCATSVASSETAVQGNAIDKKLGNQTAMRLRSLGSRHVLVKDTAFQTWYTLLNYLYTDKFNFLPLGSAMPEGQAHESSTSSLDEPRCSAKSMYRLACKVGLDYVRDEAFSYIRSNLTENNILKELSCSLVSKHPELLEMELDVLYSHIGSPVVVADFPALARRIANKEVLHGADIIIGIHTRLLREPHPSRLIPIPQNGFLASSEESEPTEESGSTPAAARENGPGPVPCITNPTSVTFPTIRPIPETKEEAKEGGVKANFGFGPPPTFPVKKAVPLPSFKNGGMGAPAPRNRFS